MNVCCVPVTDGYIFISQTPARPWEGEQLPGGPWLEVGDTGCSVRKFGYKAMKCTFSTTYLKTNKTLFYLKGKVRERDWSAIR